jgi:hypothetical protein
VALAHEHGMALGRKRAGDLLAAASAPHAVPDAVADAGVARPVILLAVVVAAGVVLGGAPSWTVGALVLLGAVSSALAVALVVAARRRERRRNAAYAAGWERIVQEGRHLRPEGQRGQQDQEDHEDVLWPGAGTA